MHCSHSFPSHFYRFLFFLPNRSLLHCIYYAGCTENVNEFDTSTLLYTLCYISINSMCTAKSEKHVVIQHETMFRLYKQMSLYRKTLFIHFDWAAIWILNININTRDNAYEAAWTSWEPLPLVDLYNYYTYFQKNIRDDAVMVDRSSCMRCSCSTSNAWITTLRSRFIYNVQQTDVYYKYI